MKLNYNLYRFKGTNILVLENDDKITFFMNYKYENFIFCDRRKGKLADITEEEIFSVWRDYIDLVIVEENILIAQLDAGEDELDAEETNGEDV